MKFRHRSLLLIFAVCCSGALARPLEVLFIGNSYVSVNNLPEVFAQIAAGASQEAPHVVMHAPGGQTLAGHCRDASLMKKLEAGFDVVILQEQSQLPAFAEVNPAVRRQFLESGQWLAKHIRQRRPDTRIILYQTWARHASAWQQKPGPGELGANAEEMQTRLSRWYREAARLCNATVAPVGEAWRANYHEAQPVMLHAADASHPTYPGTYLAALVLAKTIYDPSLVTTYHGPLAPETARQLQKLAGLVTAHH
jgi:hypothetical protein